MRLTTFDLGPMARWAATAAVRRDVPEDAKVGLYVTPHGWELQVEGAEDYPPFLIEPDGAGPVGNVRRMFSDRELDHHQEWLDEHGQPRNPDECVECTELEVRDAERR